MKNLFCLFIVVLHIGGIETALAGPDVDLDFSFPGKLTVTTKMSNHYRFDILKPVDFYVKKPDGQTSGIEAGNYQDQTLLVRSFKGNDNGTIIYSEPLGSPVADFDKTKLLHPDYVLMKSWTGGNSCCIGIGVFKTKPNFEVLLHHNNNFFDKTRIVVAPHQVELHKPPPDYVWPCHACTKYSPRVFDLKKKAWQ